VGYVKRGDRFRQRQELSFALAAYQRALQFNPNYAPAHDRLAMIQQQEAFKPSEAVLHESGTSGTQPGEPIQPRIKPRSIIFHPMTLFDQTKTIITSALAEVSAEYISDKRRHQVTHAGGSSMIDQDLQFRTFTDVLAYVPRAFVISFLAPFPAQLLFTKG